MKSKAILVVLMSFLGIMPSVAQIDSLKTQKTKPQFKAYLGLNGQINMATDGDAFYVNATAPGLRILYGKWGLAFSTFPSLRFRANDAPRPTTTIMTGVGFQLIYGSFAIDVPFYYLSFRNSWTTAFGIGYSFNLRNSKSK
jgi:hypothetical protein